MSSLKNQLDNLSLTEFNAPSTLEAAHPPETPLKLHVDGSANPNPGLVRVGLVLYHGSEIIWSGQIPVGSGTNNEAEFHAIIRGAQFLSKIYMQLPDLKDLQCTIISDSRLATNAITKSRPPLNSRLKVLYAEALTNLKTVPNSPILYWQPRERNVSADLVSHNLKQTPQAV